MVNPSIACALTKTPVVFLFRLGGLYQGICEKRGSLLHLFCPIQFKQIGCFFGTNVLPYIATVPLAFIVESFEYQALLSKWVLRYIAP